MGASNDLLLLKPDQQVTCPECEHEFALIEGFAKRALEKIEAKSADELAEREAAIRLEVEKRAKAIATQQAKVAHDETADLRKLLSEQNKKFKEVIEDVKSTEKANAKLTEDELRHSLAARTQEIQALKAREENLAIREGELSARVELAAQEKAEILIADERASLEQRLASQGQALADLRAREVTLIGEQQKIVDERAAMELETARRVASDRAGIESKIRMQEQERASLEKAELQKTIDDMKDKLTEAQRKAEQGSQQLQGEVLELALEDGLRREFPLDAVEEVKKGQRGGDVIHKIHTRQGQQAGVILWETKRAKEFSPQWVAKLKDDMRDCSADIGVLVTMPTAVPREFPAGTPFARIDDVWIVTWTFALPLAGVLQSGVLDVFRQRLATAGKGEKTEALYDFVTSPQFAQRLRAVYEAFTRLRDDLESEKNQTLQRWARREKQLSSGVAALLGIGGDLQGLAQQELPMLEMESDGDGK